MGAQATAVVVGTIGGSSGTDARRHSPKTQATGMAHQLLLRLLTWGALVPHPDASLRTTCTRRNSNVNNAKVLATSCVDEPRLGQKL